MSPTKVLIVEDEFLVRLTLVEALSDEGFDVVEAGSGDDAIQLVERMIDQGERFGLVLTDIQLPGATDGLALAAKLRQRLPTLPIIFMSGRPDGRATAKSPLDLYVAKPYLPSEICAAARRMTAQGETG